MPTRPEALLNPSDPAYQEASALFHTLKYMESADGIRLLMDRLAHGKSEQQEKKPSQSIKEIQDSLCPEHPTYSCEGKDHLAQAILEYLDEEWEKKQ